MKKFLLTLGAAIMGSGILFAQITVNATDGINLGNAIKVTNSTVKINKKISSDGNLEFAPSDQIVFRLPKGEIKFCNVMDEYILSDPENGMPVIGAAGINPDLYTSGCIAPTLHNFMDLGEKGTMFRALYVTQPVFGAMPKIKDLSGPMGTSSLQNNARVWNGQSNKIINFRQPPSSVTLSKDGFPDTQYADIVAKKEIIISGDINVSSACTLKVKAGENVIIQEGFNAEEGAVLDIAIEEIQDCINN